MLEYRMSVKEQLQLFYTSLIFTFKFYLKNFHFIIYFILYFIVALVFAFFLFNFLFNGLIIEFFPKNLHFIYKFLMHTLAVFLSFYLSVSLSMPISVFIMNIVLGDKIVDSVLKDIDVSVLNHFNLSNKSFSESISCIFKYVSIEFVKFLFHIVVVLLLFFGIFIPIFLPFILLIAAIYYGIEAFDVAPSTYAYPLQKRINYASKSFLSNTLVGALSLIPILNIFIVFFLPIYSAHALAYCEKKCNF